MSDEWRPEDFPAEFESSRIVDEREEDLTVREVHLTNEQDETLVIRVRGLREAVAQYLENIDERVAFYVGDTVLDSESDDRFDATYRGDTLTSLFIEFQLLNAQEPRSVSIWIDPLLDIVIGATHHYRGLRGPQSAKILADEGSLAMRLAGREVRVGSGRAEGTLVGPEAFNYWLEIEGFEQRNQYDLYFKSLVT